METVHWPLFGLRVDTPRLTLRYADDDDAVALAELAGRGVHDPDLMPFSVPWTDVPPPVLQRNTLQYVWSLRAHWAPENWHLQMAVVVDDDVVGVQAMLAEQYGVLRSVSTGSWLGRPYQGKGIGTEMRAAILHLAFVGLDAEEALSAAFNDNVASLAVSRKLGYEEVAERRVARRGQSSSQTQFRLTKARWGTNRRDDITISNVGPCREMFGLA